jgi:hypothetical protein
MGELRRHLTYANVMVTLLAFVVLCGGTAFAVSQLGKESVGARQLKKNAVTGAKVKDGSLGPKDVKGLKSFLPVPRGTPGPAGPTGLSGAGPAYQASGDVNYDKISSSPFGSTVVSLQVPPGSYFATSSVTVQTVNEVATYVQCRLINGFGGAGSAALQRSQAVPKDGDTYSFTLTALFSVSAAQSLNLQCNKGAAGASARITDANIVAVQVQSVSGFPG